MSFIHICTSTYDNIDRFAKLFFYLFHITHFDVANSLNITVSCCVSLLLLLSLLSISKRAVKKNIRISYAIYYIWYLCEINDSHTIYLPSPKICLKCVKFYSINFFAIHFLLILCVIQNHISKPIIKLDRQFKWFVCEKVKHLNCISFAHL